MEKTVALKFDGQEHQYVLRKLKGMKAVKLVKHLTGLSKDASGTVIFDLPEEQWVDIFQGCIVSRDGQPFKLEDAELDELFCLCKPILDMHDLQVEEAKK